MKYLAMVMILILVLVSLTAKEKSKYLTEREVTTLTNDNF